MSLDPARGFRVEPESGVFHASGAVTASVTGSTLS
jgi:hypothetical protein